MIMTGPATNNQIAQVLFAFKLVVVRAVEDFTCMACRIYWCGDLTPPVAMPFIQIYARLHFKGRLCMYAIFSL